MHVNTNLLFLDFSMGQSFVNNLFLAFPIAVITTYLLFFRKKPLEFKGVYYFLFVISSIIVILGTIFLIQTLFSSGITIKPTIFLLGFSIIVLVSAIIEPIIKRKKNKKPEIFPTYFLVIYAFLMISWYILYIILT